MSHRPIMIVLVWVRNTLAYKIYEIQKRSPQKRKFSFPHADAKKNYLIKSGEKFRQNILVHFDVIKKVLIKKFGNVSRAESNYHQGNLISSEWNWNSARIILWFRDLSSRKYVHSEWIFPRFSVVHHAAGGVSLANNRHLPPTILLNFSFVLKRI